MERKYMEHDQVSELVQWAKARNYLSDQIENEKKIQQSLATEIENLKEINELRNNTATLRAELEWLKKSIIMHEKMTGDPSKMSSQN